ncbi:MAG: hypothetical protein HC855_12740 [Rhizobiales bacterium]|nr:hypothetical protein [Hyphomicrobiales bacterium]
MSRTAPRSPHWILRRTRALLALARGNEIAALAAAPHDAFVLDRLGMHMAATQAHVSAVDFLGLHGQAVSLAKLGNIAEAKHRAAAARMRWTRKQRRRFALAIAPWSPDEAAYMLKPIHPLAAAAAALAAGDIQLARQIMPREMPRGEELQFPPSEQHSRVMKAIGTAPAPCLTRFCLWAIFRLSRQAAKALFSWRPYQHR